MPSIAVCIGSTTAEEAPRCRIRAGLRRAAAKRCGPRRGSRRGARGVRLARTSGHRLPIMSAGQPEVGGRVEQSGGSARFPERRMRRLRRTPALRRLVAETTLGVDDLVAPLFVREGVDSPVPDRVDARTLPAHGPFTARRGEEAGDPRGACRGRLRSPRAKGRHGSGAWDPDGIVQVALAELRASLGDQLVLIADLCLDEYTDHGHCGVLTSDGSVDNDATLDLYGRVAVAQAVAGADLVAPSGMMDGQVAAIRCALDGSGHPDVAILAYAAKYASSFYGPFREAVDVTIAAGGDRRSYQQDPPNVREALTEIALDVSEGADMVMVKPALPYLDVIAAAASFADVPVTAYQVSGEYAMVQAAAEKGWLDADAAAIEQLTAIKRAGARAVLTYFAGRVAELLGDR